MIRYLLLSSVAFGLTSEPKEQMDGHDGPDTHVCHGSCADDNAQAEEDCYSVANYTFFEDGDVTCNPVTDTVTFYPAGCYTDGYGCSVHVLYSETSCIISGCSLWNHGLVDWMFIDAWIRIGE